MRMKETTNISAVRSLRTQSSGPPISGSQRAPYGRREASGVPIPHTAGAQAATLPYRGETYYGEPVLHASYYGRLITTYFFVGGIAGGSQIIAAIADLSGRERDRPLVRAGRYLALAGALTGTGCLIADLHTPQRWYNMLRIFRRTSTMSIGAWTLLMFGAFSGLTAAAQTLDDALDRPLLRRIARWCGLPAAVAGEIVTTYTGTLLATTSTPLWAAGDRLLPALFATSALSTATAALSIVTQSQSTTAGADRLTRLAVIAGGAEFILANATEQRWRRQGVVSPGQHSPTKTTYRLGFQGVGVIAPLVIHGVSLLTRRRSRRWSLVAAVATLAGGYLLRSTLISAGNASARQPEEYFRFTHPEE